MMRILVLFLFLLSRANRIRLSAISQTDSIVTPVLLLMLHPGARFHGGTVKPTSSSTCHQPSNPFSVLITFLNAPFEVRSIAEVMVAIALGTFFANNRLFTGFDIRPPGRALTIPDPFLSLPRPCNAVPDLQRRTPHRARRRIEGPKGRRSVKGSGVG